MGSRGAAQRGSSAHFASQEAPPLPVHEKVDRTTRNRIEDTSSKAQTKERDHRLRSAMRSCAMPWTLEAPLYKGTLWKLNTDGNPQEQRLASWEIPLRSLRSALRFAQICGQDPTHWLKRDMWAAASSGRERQRMEGFRTLKGATVTANATKGHRFWFFLDVTVTYFSQMQLSPFPTDPAYPTYHKPSCPACPHCPTCRRQSGFA